MSGDATAARTAAARTDRIVVASEDDPIERMARDVRAALARTPRSLPSQYFYDDRGSVLFERITALPEYYLTRAEAEILEREADALLSDVRPRELFELGSGSARKTRRLVEAG